jgi:murein DD-endopeptidase MepM/ murein hydrolase activator NlpD
MRERSVRLKPGDKVQAGQAIGAMGNSGASGGVHLH